MAKKIAKHVRKSGRTTGVVPFTPSSTPVADKLGRGGPFNIKKWLRRFFDQRTPHSERLGMLRSIPHLEYSDWKESEAILRHVVMPLVDGLANDTAGAHGIVQYWRDSLATVSKLRVEAWFLLTEFFFNPQKRPYMFNNIACEGYVDDMFVFFRKISVGLCRSNVGSINLTRPIKMGYIEDEVFQHRQEDEETAKRVERAHRGMLEYLRSFFLGVWDFKNLVQYTSFDKERAEEIHNEISIKRRIEIFRNLINIESEWTKNLSWTKESFVSVVDFILDEVKAQSLSDVARLNQFGKDEHLAPLIRSSRHLIQIAFEKGWSNFEGVLVKADDTKQ
ncbi:MAG: hypothetical protein QG563_428 [Patescibacteria group bacterium]|nr:hypothetical protein [Patescibacteria group bacterium]